MVAHPFVYQLVLFALLWLFIMLHLTRPNARRAHSGHTCRAQAPQTQASPLQRAQTVRGSHPQTSLCPV